jgi:sugar/nucleoside kinase (ribokinase family)
MVCDIVGKPVSRNIFNVDSLRVDHIRVSPGGDALNAAINMGKLGLKVSLAGKVGDDMMGRFLTSEATRHGVNVSFVARSSKLATSTSIILVEEDGERHIAYCGEANDNLTLDDIDNDCISQASIVHVGSAMALGGLDGTGLAQLFKKAKSAGAVTSMDVTWDSSGQWLGKINEALHFTDVFMPSLQEAQYISGKEKPEEIALFLSQYNLKVLVIKMGSKGCFVTDFKECFTIDTLSDMKAVDTTGAGDAFVSGFLAGTIKGMSLYDKGVLGNAAASLCVSEIGATTGTRDWSGTIDFIKENSGAYRSALLRR